MTNEPLIFTTKGNIPIASVRQEITWDFPPDMVVFREKYFLGDELVKESSHVKVLTGVAITGEASS